MDTQYSFVVIEGNIGAGKTTLARMLAQDFNSRLILEQFAENPFLPKFYQNKARYAFTLEMSFLTERYHQLMRDLDNRELFHSFVLADYYFMKSLIFAKTNLQGDEYLLYRKVFNIMFSNLPKPDLYVYLHRPVSALLQLINLRNRPYEQAIQPNYLENIQTSYFEFFKQYPDNRYLIIDMQDLDYTNNPDTYSWMKQVIFGKNYDKGINRVMYPDT